ncbi:uncharacterized protein FIBRA_06162 [Fibroporia radiculosa]|uniref:3-beta hydroxysteroid dehydrogenase/isomerase domain-containing protein n=1 Tax=Fibroporia radiculosa TaxID=599839 RepID=J4GS99_9APHY|nr:uncharacterized protein FIBRA_06162 [Fibroporia radiculosa]CCM04005.1 predicted protein [Fibroporia radiculosa]
MATLWLVLGVIAGLFLYVRANDAKLKRTPPEAMSFSPQRWTEDAVRRTADRLADSPRSLLTVDQLPKQTGRRYIITGGAGFLGGWMVLHLLARGEDPRRIRVIDIRMPARKDLTEGAAKDVDYILVDVTDAKAVDAAFSKPWPSAQSDVPGAPEPEVTVFHTAATIRFFERHPDLLRHSNEVNVRGTENVVNAARRVGVSTLVSTSSGSICVWNNRFWLWPWEKEPKYFVQPVNDDSSIPKRHEDYFSNYAASKHTAEKFVRAADKTPSGQRVLRTGCIRPGNGIYGPGGDLMVGNYLTRKTNPSWIQTMIQSLIYAENCSLAHLCYEARLIELQQGSKNPDIGGQAFCVADAGPPPLYGEVYDAVTQVSKGQTEFMYLSFTAMLALAQLVEWYYLARYFLLQSRFAFLGRIMPPVTGDIVFLQPSMWALTGIHLWFNDSRARLAPEKGGLGYNGDITTMEGVCKSVIEHQRDGGKSLQRVIAGHKEVGHGFAPNRAENGPARIIAAVENGPAKIIEKVESGIAIHAANGHN